MVKDLHKACYDLGQSGDIESPAFKRYYPDGEDKNFTGRQWDSQEFMIKLLEIIDENNQLSNPVSEGYIIESTDGLGENKQRTGTAQSIISVPIDGRSLEACLAPKTEVMQKDEWVTFSDGRKHPANKTNFLVHPQPGAVERFNIQVKAYTTDMITENVKKLTDEARALILRHPFEQIKVPLVNETSQQTENIPMHIKSIVAHSGASSDVGHYVTYEKQGNQWYLYDDSTTKPVDLKKEFDSHRGRVPYMFQYERVKQIIDGSVPEQAVARNTAESIPEKPEALSMKITVFYDGDCPLCTREVSRWKQAPFLCTVDWFNISGQDDELRARGIDPHQALLQLHTQTDDGRTLVSIDSYALLLNQLPRWRWAGCSHEPSGH